jgi:hypothetical protein
MRELKLVTWNAIGITNKTDTLKKELASRSADIAAVTETTWKLKGNTRTETLYEYVWWCPSINSVKKTKP